jgi:hypothetical protein
VKGLNKIFCLLLVVFLTLISISSFAQGQTKTMVKVSPSSMKVKPAQTAAFDIKVDSVENLFAASVVLEFDSSILSYSNTIGGSFLTRNNANSVFLGVVQQPPHPAIPNRITVDQAIYGGRTVSGSGILFTIIFTALHAGSSPISIVSVELRNGSNKFILAQSGSGNITVNNAPMSFQLLSPVLGGIIDTTLCVTLVWSKSNDIDVGDFVRYSVHLTSAFSNLNFNNLTGTSLSLTKDILKENTEWSWFVDATDGIDTTSSDQTFMFKTPIVSHSDEIPEVLKVEQNYPNPFTRSTSIRFSVPLSTLVEVKVYDITGREIVRLMSAHVAAGYSFAIWDGKNSRGTSVGSGIYLCVVSAGSYNEVKKMVLLK